RMGRVELTYGRAVKKIMGITNPNKKGVNEDSLHYT
ncbi:hypothetical protein SFB3_369G1, partial [Candidatus Arthromitus sp. SFB-3]